MAEQHGGGSGHPAGHDVPLDPGRVDLLDPEDVRYWCGEFDCTEEELRQVVASVGNHATAVRQEFNGPG